MADGHDFNDMARRITALPDLIKPGDIAKMCALLEGLKGLPFPPGYLHELRDDMLRVLLHGKTDATYVYLSFYGMGDKATHLKIGIARSVKNRMSAIKSGNPLPRMWTYAARFPVRDHALRAESALLHHMAADKVHGEWVHVHGLSEQAALAVVQSLGEVASGINGYAAHFHKHED